MLPIIGGCIIFTGISTFAGYIIGVFWGFFNGVTSYGADMGLKIGFGVSAAISLILMIILIPKAIKEDNEKKEEEQKANERAFRESQSWACPVCKKVVYSGSGKCTATPDCTAWRCFYCFHVNITTENDSCKNCGESYDSWYRTRLMKEYANR